MFPVGSLSANECMSRRRRFHGPHDLMSVAEKTRAFCTLLWSTEDEDYFREAVACVVALRFSSPQANYLHGVAFVD